MSDTDATRPNAFLDYVVDSRPFISSALVEMILYPSWFVSTMSIMRPQLSTTGVIDEVYKENGLLGFYPGMIVGVAHRALTNSLSKNIFQIMTGAESEEELKENLKTESTIDFTYSIYSVIASGISALFTTPLLTLQNNIIASPSLTVFEVWNRLTSSYGASVLFRGAIPNIIGSMIRKSVYIFGTPYVGDLMKCLVSPENHKTLNALTFLGVSFLSTFLSAPFNFALVYLQASKNFDSMSDCWKYMSEPGVSVLWSGFPAHFVYQAPRGMLQWYIDAKIGEIIDGRCCST